MTKTVSHTHALIDGRGKAWNVGDGFLQERPGLHRVALADLDIAQLAAIAAQDCSALLKQGDGWLGVGTHPAQPYLSAMQGMRGVNADNIKTVTFGHDRADRVVLYFLENVSTWRGEVARSVKAVLRAKIA